MTGSTAAMADRTAGPAPDRLQNVAMTVAANEATAGALKRFRPADPKMPPLATTHQINAAAYHAGKLESQGTGP